MVTQVTWFLFTVSSFSTSDQDWLSTNNYNLLNPLFLYTNFTSLILLTHSSLTNSSSVLPLFYRLCLVISFLPFCTGFLLKMIRALSLRVTVTLWVHPLTPISFVFVCHHTMWSQKTWTPPGEGMQVCLFYCFSLLLFYLANLPWEFLLFFNLILHSLLI